MDKKKLKKWLLKQVKLINLCRRNGSFNKDINVLHYVSENVLLSNCRNVAETLGIDYKSSDWINDGNTANCVTFDFCGISFFELENYKEGE